MAIDRNNRYSYIPSMSDIHPDSQIIDALGGTAEVARLCRIKSPSVSEWRKNGIPSARRDFLELKYPDVFASMTKKAA